MEVRPDQVRSGLSLYDRSQSRLDEANARAMAGITGVDPGAVFGTDPPGQAFLSTYLQNGGPAEVLFGPTGGGGIVAALREGGRSIATALADLEAQEAANAAAVARSGDGAPPAARA